MSFSIQTNVNSLVAQENLRVNTNFQSQTIQRLTSGYRINSSADDAAGLAIANKFRSDVAELSQGVRNANDGVAQLQIIDGGMSNIGKMLDRLKTLATQSASDTFTGNRKWLNSEYQTLVGEIDRQAQSVGLTSGGSFAKNLSIYLGGGAGTTTAATLSNGTVSIDLSKATVDARSLGLQGVQAANSATYDLSSASATSVQKILADSVNSVGGSVSTTTFKFFGAGFANDSTGAYSGVSATVNLNGVGDVNGLVNSINAAIDTAGNQATGAAASFKAANIRATVVTDADGNQKLGFTSSNSSFQVQAEDRTSNALMGNFAADGSSSATGAQMGTTVDARAAASAAGNAAWNLFAANASVTLTVTGAGMSSPKSVVLNTNYGVIGSFATLTAIATDITTQLGVTGLTVTDNGGKLQFTSTAGAFTISASSKTAGSLTAMGMSATATAAGTSASAGATYSDFVANGSYEMGSTSGGTTSAANFGWTNVAALSQAITVNATDPSGAAHAKTITLTNGTTGASIGAAVSELNTQLQKSNDSTLQQITAVQVNDNGVQKINFVSTLSNFSVSLGTNATGMTDSAGNMGKTVQASQVGSAMSADISTAAGAKSAISALSSAVTALGTAQAAVGKGQNQLGYAISLAQSQINNFSSAQAQIRDADVASEAANLTKAQVLQQASIAAMAQANSAPQAVLSLLRG